MRWGLFGGIGVAITATVAALFLSPLQSQERRLGPAYQPHRGGSIPIGMNLSLVTYWGKGTPFIDRFKTSGTWAAPGPKGPDGKAAPVPVDADGYPLAIPAGADRIGIQFAVDPAGSPTDDSFVLTYRGNARIGFGRAAIVSSQPGRILFKVTGKEGTVTLNVLSMDAKDPIRDIHVVRSDQLDLFAKGETFNPAFLQMASHFSALRFMVWGRTNDLGPIAWADRSKPSDSSWSRHVDGVPLEIMVRLANEAHADMWYNVRLEADDVFVRNAATYIRDNLAPGLKLHLEYGNEVWNWGFRAARLTDGRAKALWGGPNCPVADVTVTADKCGTDRMTYYGYRAAQIQAITRQVFGAQANKRVVGVMGAFQRMPALSEKTIEGVQRAKVGTVPELFGEYAITTYFGIRVDKKNPDVVMGWARSGASGLDAAFHEMEYGGALPTDLSIAEMADLAAQHAKLAKANGMRMVAYEGGVALVPKQAPPEDVDALTEFYDRIVADPRMGDLYDAMATSFAGAGGTLAMHFEDVGPANKFGYWGAIPSVYDTTTPRYRMLVKIAARTRPAPHP